MRILDCFGDMCPIPILKLQKEVTTLSKGEALKMVVDHSCVIESIQDYLKNRPYHYEVEEVMNGVWEIIISKCE